MVFPPYNAQELAEILRQRVGIAFRPGTVDESAITNAAAIAAQESGDARTAVMLLLRAGEIADRKNSGSVTDEEVKKAKKQVEEEKKSVNMQRAFQTEVLGSSRDINPTFYKIMMDNYKKHIASQRDLITPVSDRN